MTKPKFNIEDKIFILDDGKVEEHTVLGIFAVHREENNVLNQRKNTFEKFKYCLKPLQTPDNWYWISEERIFKTKEELIASL